MTLEWAVTGAADSSRCIRTEVTALSDAPCNCLSTCRAPLGRGPSGCTAATSSLMELASARCGPVRIALLNSTSRIIVSIDTVPIIRFC